MSKCLRAFAFFAVLFGSMSEAHSAGMFHFGVQLGPSVQAGSSMGMAFGITSTYRIRPFLAVGLNYFTTGVGATANGSVASQTSTTSSGRGYFGGEANLVMGGNLSNLIPGVRVGIVGITSTGTTTDASGVTSTFTTSTTNLFMQPKIGYDINVGRFTMGPELSYTIVFGSAGALNILGTFKFWL